MVNINLGIEDQQWVDEVIIKITEKMAWVSEKSKDKIPYLTINGTHDNRASMEGPIDDGINWWTNGFWGGMLWLMYYETKKERYADIARISEEKLDQCFNNFYGLHHDVGFMWLPTAVADYRITGNSQSRKRALHAANLLAGRFNPVGQFIRAWNDIEGRDTRGWAIIDSLFNIPLLYWASEETKDPRFKHIAMLHADTVMKNFIREDGSSCHIVEFNPQTGERVRSYGGQGYTRGSSWTRGQGWALYGLIISYMHTKKEEYLETALKVADYCMENLPESGIIPVDFCQPSEPDFEDSCGACVIACGLIEAARHVSGEKSEKYLEGGKRILKAISETRSDFTQDCDSIVLNCSGDYHGPIHHITMTYADFFFMEAMFKLKGSKLFVW